MIRLKFEPRDLWVGAYIDTAKQRLYVCAVPALPVVVDIKAVAEKALDVAFGKPDWLDDYRPTFVPAEVNA